MDLDRDMDDLRADLFDCEILGPTEDGTDMLMWHEYCEVAEPTETPQHVFSTCRPWELVRLVIFV